MRSTTLASMNDAPDTVTEGLVDEIARYLAAVDVFRDADCEPTWRPESTRLPTIDEPLLATTATAPSAH